MYLASTETFLLRANLLLFGQVYEDHHIISLWTRVTKVGGHLYRNTSQFHQTWKHWVEVLRVRELPLELFKYYDLRLQVD